MRPFLCLSQSQAKALTYPGPYASASQAPGKALPGSIVNNTQ